MASAPDDRWSRATSGDFGALREIVFRMAYGFTLDYARAEDVAQEALTKIWLRSPNWKSIENPKAWIARVVLNASRTEWRKWGRAEVVPDEGRNSEHLDELIMLRMGLQKIPRRDRQLVLILGVCGASYAEAATILRMNEGAVPSAFARAKDKLRKAMGETS
ncbi:MAG: RNA polymerase sigma factor [Armatimonadetes bacterium]|nr:RNA polymerase sigma factor [Armatimonadota bacterium]